MQFEMTDHQVDGELIPTANGRDLQRELKNDTVYTTWMQRAIEAAYLVENTDFIVSHNFVSNSQGGRPPKEYHLTIESCKAIAMMQRSETGKKVRDYFIQLEKGRKPMSLTDQLRATADAIDKAAAEGIKAQGMVQALSERTTTHEAKTSRNFSKAKVVINKHAEEIIALKQTIAEIQANHKGIERCPMGYTVWSVLRRTLDKQISKEAWMAMFSHYSVSVENWDKPEAKAPGGIQPTPVYNIAEAKIAYDAWMADSAPSSKCFFTHDGSGTIFKYKDKRFPFIPSK